MLEDIDRILLREPDIQARIEELAFQIARDYHAKDLTIVALLNGSVFFLADLLRRIALPVHFTCLRVSSYEGDQSTGEVRFAQEATDIAINAAGRHLLILDDILDTGCTLQAVRARFSDQPGALSLKTCVLLKKSGTRTCPVEADYWGFEIENAFVVGYGLDYRDRYRNLPFIGILKQSAISS